MHHFWRVVQAYLCDIGDGKNLSENLSTFSAHITNVLALLRESNRDSFVIMDELGSGTDPTEGMGIAIAIIEELRKSGCFFLVTTHYPEVKEYAARTDGILNARMTFDKETLRPTYQMVIGEAGESCAFYIADRLGMPNDMLRVAIRAAYGENAGDSYHFRNAESIDASHPHAKLQMAKKPKHAPELSTKFAIGDSTILFIRFQESDHCSPTQICRNHNPSYSGMPHIPARFSRKSLQYRHPSVPPYIRKHQSAIPAPR